MDETMVETMDETMKAQRDRSPNPPPWLAPAIAGTAFALIFVAETRTPLRKQRESRARRTARNAVMAGLTAAALSVLQAPLLFPLAERVERKRQGLLPQLPLPPLVRAVAGVLLLDYTLWWWHWLNHRVPFLWRFHRVHHTDRDMDASTAVRFHFGEMSLSVFYRMAQIRLLGVDRATLSTWQRMLMVSIFFHHSNIRLPPASERRLVRWLVTPRMHGIHHSTYRDETDSNWASLFTWWDMMHGTMRLSIPQSSITIGVAGFQHPEDVTLPELIAMPLGLVDGDWVGADGMDHVSR
jgi:sterol desaturase/sphingolipid hydroxylase (fatty acid hydroxylase superfamily)